MRCSDPRSVVPYRCRAPRGRGRLRIECGCCLHSMIGGFAQVGDRCFASNVNWLLRVHGSPLSISCCSPATVRDSCCDWWRYYCTLASLGNGDERIGSLTRTRTSRHSATRRSARPQDAVVIINCLLNDGGVQCKCTHAYVYVPCARTPCGR